MTEAFARIALGPLLLIQGLYTRWVTPKLPEAEGERQGVAGCGVALRLLILGDSAAAGVGAATQDEAITGKLVARLANDYRITWTLWAQSGLDSQALLNVLERNSPEPFDVVLLCVGVNDVTSRISADQWLAQQDRLMELLSGKYAVKQIVVSPLPPMHLFPALPQPLRWYLGSRASRFNHRLAGLAERKDHCTLLAISLAPVAGLMAADGFHPGPAIYSLWADHAARAIQQRFQHNKNTGS
ncbi:GDSL-like Lipase/Acylhydrolase [compost metagenome]